MPHEPPYAAPPPDEPPPDDGDADHPPGRPIFALSTRTAAEASQGMLLDRLLELQARAGETDPAAPAPPSLQARTHPWREARTALECSAPSAQPSRAAARDQVRVAAQAYVLALVREGVAPIAAVEAVRATVHEGAAFLSARRLAALERSVVRAARAVC